MHIPADASHPVLNLSHAVAVVLYALYAGRQKKKLYKLAKAEEVRYLEKLFFEIVDELAEQTQPRLRDPKKVKTAFKRVFSRGQVAQSELDALVGVFARMNKILRHRSK